MNVLETIRVSLESIRANKVRAILTALGIIIGISAVIASLSVGQGAQSSILEQVQGLGSNTITIIPVSNIRQIQSSSPFGGGGGGGRKLDYRIVSLLENKVRFKEIESISPEVGSSYDISSTAQTQSLQVYGITPAFYSIRAMELGTGKEITDQDNQKFSKVAMLGSSAATKLFGESEPIGQNIRIKGLTFKVIGIFQEKGNTTYDERVYVPINVVTNFLIGDKNYSQIVVQLNNPDLIDTVVGRIQTTLLDYFRIKDADKANFSAFSSKDILSITQSITGIFTVLLASIAGISLIVGGIGIMNIMLVSVTERTKEIGLRKAVGARQNAILLQFLIEAIVLTLTGGIIGMILGSLMGLLIGKVGNIPVIISFDSVFLAVSVSVSIGIVFGFYPAYRAAKLNPIDALKYE